MIIKKGMSKGCILLLMALSVFSMCACSREESGTAADQETGVDDVGTQTEPAKGNEDDNEAEAPDTAKASDTTEAVNLFIVEPVMCLDVTAPASESQNIIDTISRLPASDLETAVTYRPLSEAHFSGDHVVLLCQSETGRTSVYGYESDAYGSRGIILDFIDKYSYYDYMWDANWGRMDVYEQDLDQDGVVEAAFCFGGAHGTGTSTDRLVIFDDIGGDGTLTAYEFTPDQQLQQLEQNIQFIMDMGEKKLRIRKDGQIEKSIDWGIYEDQVVGDTFGIDCLNFVRFELNGDEIRMGIDIGILFNVVGGPSQFPEDNEFYLDIEYADGTFQIQ